MRVADEIVDGGVLDTIVAARSLNELETETDSAIGCGYSANLIVHAFALTARDTGFGAELTAPFFDSMRTDLTATHHDQASFERYVYGSAEVVGLMCLHAFLLGQQRSSHEQERLERGARALGSAFQKVNFLRDLNADHAGLGRSYFPGSTSRRSRRRRSSASSMTSTPISTVAGEVIPELPRGCRRAVALAHGLFAELSARLRKTPADQLVQHRIRVPNPVKARIALAAVVRG